MRKQGRKAIFLLVALICMFSIVPLKDTEGKQAAKPEAKPIVKTAAVPAHNAVYMNHKYGFTFPIPASWGQNYKVEEVAKNYDGFKAVAFTEKKHNYPLVEIALIPLTVWKEYADSLYMPLGQKNGYMYAAFMPSETLYEKDKSGNEVEVTSVTAMLNDVANAFRNKKFTFAK
jgi:hypothetical protein